MATVPEPLQIGQRHPDHHGEQVCLKVQPAARVRGGCVLEARAGRQVAGRPLGGQLGGNVVLLCLGQHAGLAVPAAPQGAVCGQYSSMTRRATSLAGSVA
jgi:hypothetical protein